MQTACTFVTARWCRDLVRASLVGLGFGLIDGLATTPVGNGRSG